MWGGVRKRWDNVGYIKVPWGTIKHSKVLKGTLKGYLLGYLVSTFHWFLASRRGHEDWIIFINFFLSFFFYYRTTWFPGSLCFICIIISVIILTIKRIQSNKKIYVIEEIELSNLEKAQKASEKNTKRDCQFNSANDVQRLKSMSISISYGLNCFNGTWYRTCKLNTYVLVFSSTFTHLTAAKIVLLTPCD